MTTHYIYLHVKVNWRVFALFFNQLCLFSLFGFRAQTQRVFCAYNYYMTHTHTPTINGGGKPTSFFSLWSLSAKTRHNGKEYKTNLTKKKTKKFEFKINKQKDRCAEHNRTCCSMMIDKKVYDRWC